MKADKKEQATNTDAAAGEKKSLKRNDQIFLLLKNTKPY